MQSIAQQQRSNVALRPFQAQDRQAVLELLHELPELYPGGSGWLDERLDQVLLNEAYCTLAIQDQRPVGIMIETPKPGNRLKISTLYVASEYRGGGVGRILVQAGLRRWLRAQLDYVYVTVDHRLAEQMQRLLGPQGFETVAMDHDRYGKGRHETVLRLSLMARNRRFIISIGPYHAARIWAGEKPYEFRRRSVRLATGDLAVVYETAPVSAITGTFSVGQLVRGLPSDVVTLEPNLHEQSTLLQYLDGTQIATAIEILDIRPRVAGLPLEALGLRQAPQSYQFLSGLQSEALRLIG